MRHFASLSILSLAACGAAPEIKSVVSHDTASDTAVPAPATVAVAPASAPTAPVDANVTVSAPVEQGESGNPNQACGATLNANTVDPEIQANGGNPTCSPIDPNTGNQDYRYGSWTLQIGRCIETNLDFGTASLDASPESHGTLGPAYPQPDNLVIPVFSLSQEQSGAWTIQAMDQTRASALDAGTATFGQPSRTMFRAYPDGSARYVQFFPNSQRRGIACTATAIPAP